MTSRAKRGTGLILTILYPLLSGGCASDAGTSDRSTVFEVTATPIVTLGTASGDSILEFFRIVTPFLMPDGRIVVPQAGTNSVRVFDPEGAFAYELGRKGEGPGEFTGLSSAWSRADTIEVYDSRLGRVTRFSSDGNVQVVTLQDLRLRSMTAIPGTAGDGWVTAGIAGARMGMRDSILVTQFGPDGHRRADLAQTVGMARFQARGMSGPEPLSPRARIKLANGKLYVAETLSPKIRVQSVNGQPLGEITWHADNQLDAASTLRAVIDSVVQALPADRAESTRRRLEAAPIPPALSAFWDFIVDDEGLVWVQSYDPFVHAAARGGLGRGSYLTGPVRGGNWQVLTPQGALLGGASIPADLEVVQITRDKVLGIAVDSLGVEQVRVHHLVRH